MLFEKWIIILRWIAHLVEQTWLECLFKIKKRAKVDYTSPSRSVRSLIYLTTYRFWTVERFVFWHRPLTARRSDTTKKSPSQSQNMQHIYHYLFIRTPFQMRSLAYRLLQAAVFIQLFDSPKRASGEIPTDRASRCSLLRQPLHFYHSLLFSNKNAPLLSLFE